MLKHCRPDILARGHLSLLHRFDLHIITHHHSEVYCGYVRSLFFGNSLTFSHIPLCFHAKPPNFPRLFDPRDYNAVMCIGYLQEPLKNDVPAYCTGQYRPIYGTSMTKQSIVISAVYFECGC